MFHVFHHIFLTSPLQNNSLMIFSLVLQPENKDDRWWQWFHVFHVFVRCLSSLNSSLKSMCGRINVPRFQAQAQRFQDGERWKCREAGGAEQTWLDVGGRSSVNRTIRYSNSDLYMYIDTLYYTYSIYNIHIIYIYNLYILYIIYIYYIYILYYIYIYITYCTKLYCIIMYNLIHVGHHLFYLPSFSH